MLTDNSSFVSVFHTLPSAPYILDEHNRARIFHGTNFVVKNEPWYPASLLNETHVATLASMGMNTVRLGYMWSGAQPVPGTFNQTYIDIMDQIITLLNKYEIYPFLDVHQDVMSSYFCLYDAFPTWVVGQSDKSQHAFPWPLKSDPVTGDPCPADRGWGSNYISEACGTAFQSLYTAGSPMEQAFMSYWEMIAAHHKTKAILGYELINEPWAGNIYSDPTLLLPGHAGSRNLGPFYDRVAEKIRSVDSTHLLFYEPVTWGMIFNGTVLGSGFEHVPGGPDHADQAVFSFHYYCWWYSDLNHDFQRQSCDQVFAPKVFRQVIHCHGILLYIDEPQQPMIVSVSLIIAISITHCFRSCVDLTFVDCIKPIFLFNAYCNLAYDGRWIKKRSVWVAQQCLQNGVRHVLSTLPILSTPLRNAPQVLTRCSICDLALFSMYYDGFLYSILVSPHLLFI